MIFKNTGAEFDAIFNNAAIGIVVVDYEGTIVVVNDFLLKQFGYASADELVGNKIEKIIPPRYRERHVGHRSNYHGSNAHNRPMGLGLDLFGFTKDGREVPVEVSLSPYRNENGEFYIAFVSDITKRKKTENEILKLNAELERKVDERTQSLTQALEREKELSEMKSRFVSMASHQFKTPLSTIISSAYLLGKYTLAEEQPKRDKHLQRITASGDMLNNILNDFLSAGKIDEGRIQVRPMEFNISEQLHEIIMDLQTLLKAKQQIFYKHEGPEIVMLDLSLFRHIVMNLLSNAIKFSAEDGAIHVYSSQNDDAVMLQVKDSGIGISAEDQQHLFERFFRGGNASNIQGTGLGLHIVAKYAEMLNGSVNFNSKLNEGTTFTVSFAKQNNG